MNFGVIFVSILSSFAYEIRYKVVLPWTMCCLSSRPSCDLAISYMLVFMVLNATFNNISVTSWRSVLLVEETWVSRENSRSVASHRQTLSHNVVSSTPHNVSGDRHWLLLQVVINPTTIRSRTRCIPPLFHIIYYHDLWSQGQISEHRVKAHHTHHKCVSLVVEYHCWAFLLPEWLL
jgi:hypothetical protein